MYKPRPFLSSARHVLLPCLAALTLCACSGTDQLTFNPDQSVHEVIDAATGPLEDLNIKQREIPPLLKKAAADPYALPPKTKCPEIQEELAQLDGLLGPDIRPTGIEYADNETILSDVQNIEIPDTAALTKSGIEFARDSLMSTIRSHTSVIPFRSIVRRVTGADRHQRQVEEAYQAGKLRRAYLKGVAQSRFGDRCLTSPPLPRATGDTPANSKAV